MSPRPLPDVPVLALRDATARPLTIPLTDELYATWHLLDAGAWHFKRPSTSAGAQSVWDCLCAAPDFTRRALAYFNGTAAAVRA